MNMAKKESNNNDEILRRLDVIAIYLLAQKGFKQKEISKILKVGDHRIKEIFGDTYTKILLMEKE